MMGCAVVLCSRKEPYLVPGIPELHKSRDELIGGQAAEPPEFGRHYGIIPQDLVILARFSQAAACCSWSKVTVRY